MEKILLIEDDIEMCEIIRNYFAEKGTEVFAVQNGTAAAELIREGVQSYALVLLDIMLPRRFFALPADPDAEQRGSGDLHYRKRP